MCVRILLQKNHTMYHTTRLPWLSERLRSVVTVHAPTLGRTGTGFVVSADGHLLTAAHCVVDDSSVPFGGEHETEEDITVAFHDGGTYSVQLVGFDMHADVAVLRLPPDVRLLSPIPVRRHTYPQPGDTCVVVGNIFGQDPRSVAVGAVRNGRWKDPHGLSLLSTVLTDVATGAGTSGGPILDTAGHVVALHTAAYGAPPHVCTTCGRPFRSVEDVQWHQEQQESCATGVGVRTAATPSPGTTQLGGGVASKMLWSIYQAILRNEEPSAPLVKWTVCRGIGTITHIDGQPTGPGTVHDVTWFLGPGTVVVRYAGRDDTIEPLVPLPPTLDVAVGSIQTFTELPVNAFDEIIQHEQTICRLHAGIISSKEMDQSKKYYSKIGELTELISQLREEHVQSTGTESGGEEGSQTDATSLKKAIERYVTLTQYTKRHMERNLTLYTKEIQKLTSRNDVLKEDVQSMESEEGGKAWRQTQVKVFIKEIADIQRITKKQHFYTEQIERERRIRALREQVQAMESEEGGETWRQTQAGVFNEEIERHGSFISLYGTAKNAIEEQLYTADDPNFQTMITQLKSQLPLTDKESDHAYEERKDVHKYIRERKEQTRKR